MGTGRPPDFRLVLWSPTSKANGQLGVAWQNEKGNINIKLNPGASLAWRALEIDGLKLMLKPVHGGQFDPRFPPPDPDVPPGGDDVPF